MSGDLQTLATCRTRYQSFYDGEYTEKKVTIEEVTTMVEKITFGEYTPVFEKMMADMRGDNPNFRGNAVRSRGAIPVSEATPFGGKERWQATEATNRKSEALSFDGTGA